MSHLARRAYSIRAGYAEGADYKTVSHRRRNAWRKDARAGGVLRAIRIFDRARGVYPRDIADAYGSEHDAVGSTSRKIPRN